MSGSQITRGVLAGSVAFGVAAAAGPLAIPAEAAPPHPATTAATSTASPSSGLSPSPAASAQVRIAPRGKLLGVGARGFSWTDMQAERIRWTAYDDGRTVDLGSSRLVPGSLFEWDADSSDLVARVEYDENWVLQAVTLFDPVAGTSQAIGLAGLEYVGTYGGAVLGRKPLAAGGAEFRLVGMRDGVRAERTIDGLSSAKSWVVTGSAPGLLTMEQDLGRGVQGGTAVVVDLAKAAVVTRQPVPGTGFSDRAAAVSATHTARLTSPGGSESAALTVLDRATGASRQIPLAAQSKPVVALLGTTAVYGTSGEAHSSWEAPMAALKAVPVAGGTPRTLLDHASQVLPAPDGSLIVRGGSLAQGQGLFRITLVSGSPVVKKIATTGEPTQVVLLGTEAPAVAEPDKGPWRIRWNLSRRNVRPYLTITHKATGMEASGYVPPPRDDAGWIEHQWSGWLNMSNVEAPNGAYTWAVSFEPVNGIGPTVKATGAFTLKRTAPASGHDFNDNGTTDVLTRDTDGGLWRTDTFGYRSRGTAHVTSGDMARVGGGWNAYDELVAAGNLGGHTVGDLLARDRTGTLWLYAGKGAAGTFAPRTKVGSGWNTYTALTGGSDFTGDGRADLLARDRSGVLWLYKGTGSLTKPYTTRARVGGGWNGYDRITAAGNIAGGPAGDLVARDGSGTLWLYTGKGNGTFTARTRIGTGWKAYTALVAAGDYNKDGWSDTLAFGGGQTYVYWGTGNWRAPFSARALAPGFGYDTTGKIT
ncbi:FG-GAP repeat domain-containing protein [Streptomyces sp. NPDC002073]